MEDDGIFFAIWSILQFVYFVAIWYILGLFGIFFPALKCCTKKNLATLIVAHL
jgi:hypothetical protein